MVNVGLMFEQLNYNAYVTPPSSKHQWRPALHCTTRLYHASTYWTAGDH